tara:strand:+ start:373 stop:477 length:105 start_codon:yes stop_codon:yes gene_type:complete
MEAQRLQQALFDLITEADTDQAIAETYQSMPSRR